MVAHLSRRHRRRPAGAGRRAEAARSRQHAGGAGGRRSRADVWRRARQEGGRAAGRARRHAHHGRPDGLQGATGSIRSPVELSRPHRPRAAAALRGVPVPADPAHPRRLRSRQAASATASSISTPCCAPSASRRACASPTACPRRRSSPSFCRTAMSRACGRGCATASRSTGRPSNGRRRRKARGPHHVVLDRRQRRQHGVRDAEPRQRVRLGRRRAGHRRLPQQLPLLGRREPRRAPTA